MKADIESLTIDQLGRELATCVQRLEWLSAQMRAVEEWQSAVIMRLRTMPAEQSEPVTERLSRFVDCPEDCYVPFRHFHTADGAVHEVDLR